jgi:hypothetical protein
VIKTARFVDEEATAAVPPLMALEKTPTEALHQQEELIYSEHMLYFLLLTSVGLAQCAHRHSPHRARVVTWSFRPSHECSFVGSTASLWRYAHGRVQDPREHTSLSLSLPVRRVGNTYARTRPCVVTITHTTTPSSCSTCC